MTLGENKGCHARLAPPPSAAPTFQPVVIRSGRGRTDTLALMLEHDKQVQADQRHFVRERRHERAQQNRRVLSGKVPGRGGAEAIAAHLGDLPMGQTMRT